MDSKDSDQTGWMRSNDMSHCRADILYLGEKVTYDKTKRHDRHVCKQGIRSVGESFSLKSLLAVKLEMLWIINCS